MPEVARLHAENYGVYGRRKMHALMRRQCWDVGRDQTERLMRLAGVRGVKRSKRMQTTRRDLAASLPADLVQRRFTAQGPRRLWVADIPPSTACREVPPPMSRPGRDLPTLRS